MRYTYELFPQYLVSFLFHSICIFDITKNESCSSQWNNVYGGIVVEGVLLETKGRCPEQQIDSSLAEKFLRYLGVSTSSAQLYKKGLAIFFSYLYEHGIRYPCREDILAFRETLRSRYKAATVQAYIVAVRRFFKWLVLEGFYQNDITEGIKGAKIGHCFKKDYLTSTQVKSILDRIDVSTQYGIRDYALFALMVTTGLRTIEVVRANIGDLRPLGNKTVLYIQGKGRDDKAEYVDVSSQVETCLRMYIQQSGVKDPSAALFSSIGNRSRGKRLQTRAIRGIVKKRLKDAGFDTDRLTSHSLRHTAITLSLLGGRSLAEAQQFARHVTITTTQMYNHALERDTNKCAEVVANQIF